MTITVDWSTKVIDSSASIADLPTFHAALRDLEDDATGAIYPVTHTWKALDLGSGAFFYALELINGYTLRFPTPGNYTITGNLGGAIVPVAGVYVERKTSAAFATTALGGSGPSAASIAAQVRTELAAELLRITEVAKIHGLVQGVNLVVTPTSRTAGDIAQTISGDGVSSSTVSRA